MQIEAKLQTLGLVLPPAPIVPPTIKISFAWTRRCGNRVYVPGHAPLHPDGSPAGPFGKVPTEVSIEAAQQAARNTALAIQPQTRAGRPRPRACLVDGLRDGQRRAWLCADYQRDQRLLGLGS